MASKRCEYCRAVVYGNGIEAMYEHLWECEAYLEQMLEDEGFLESTNDLRDSGEAGER